MNEIPDRFFGFAFLALGAVALWSELQRRSTVDAPTSGLTPNANANSEHARDLAQSRNSGYAPTPPFVISEGRGDRTLTELLSPSSWPRLDMTR